jgi:hypothetical protein
MSKDLTTLPEPRTDEGYEFEENLDGLVDLYLEGPLGETDEGLQEMMGVLSTWIQILNRRVAPKMVKITPIGDPSSKESSGGYTNHSSVGVVVDFNKEGKEEIPTLDLDTPDDPFPIGQKVRVNFKAMDDNRFHKATLYWQELLNIRTLSGSGEYLEGMIAMHGYLEPPTDGHKVVGFRIEKPGETHSLYQEVHIDHLIPIE